MKKELNKKGEMTSKMLITIILLITGFVILLFVYLQIAEGDIDREVCHQSVILRATIPNIAQSFIPLKCKTAKICVKGDKFFDRGKCEEEFGDIKGISKVKVDKVEQIEKVISQEIIDCWTMMGEGKVSLFQQYWAENYGIGGVYPTCVICSRIAFDEESLEKIDLSKVDVIEYMKANKIPNGKETYYDYLSGEEGKISIKEGLLNVKDIKEEVKDNTKTLKADSKDSVDVEEQNLEVVKINHADEIAVLFMQISAPSHGDSVLNLGKTVLGVGVVGGYFFGPSVMLKGIRAIGLKGGLITIAAAIVGVGAQQLNVAYQRSITSGYCGDISTGTEARNGCSVVRTVNYNVEDIKQYCSVIESIP